MTHTGRRRAPRIGRLTSPVIVVCALLAVAASPPKQPKVVTPTTVNVGTLVPETSFDPYKNETGYFLQYLQPLYDTLIRRRGDGSYVADLATAWRYAPGSKNTLFTLTVRKGVKFADGTPLNAAAVKANLDYAKTANGPRAAQLASIASVATSGQWTVTIKLSTSDPSLPLTLSGVNGMMVSPKALLDPVALDGTPSGAGPYVLDPTQTTAGTRYVYVRNPHYWQPQAFPFDRLVIRVYPTASAAFAALRAGQVDMAPGVPADLAAGKRAKLSALAWTSSCLGLWLWDRSGKLAPPLAKLAVRQALNYAVDRRAIFKSLYNGQGVAGTQIFVPGSAGYEKALDSHYPYDPARARKLLAQAGYSKGFTLPVLSVPVADPQAQAIARYLKAVGVKMQIEDVQPSTLPNEIAKPRFPALLFSYNWQDAYQDSQSMVLPGGFYNPFGSSDAQVTSLWKKAAQAATPAAAQKLFQQESARIVDLAWFLIVGYDKTIYWVNTRRIAGVTTMKGQPVPAIYGWKPVRG